IVIGEGGSGGALALGVGDRLYMLENSTYSVISPEGAAALLWKDAAKAQQAAETMKITAPDLQQFNVVDQIIPEPKGGAHRDVLERAEQINKQIDIGLNELKNLSVDELLENRWQKYKQIGDISE